MNANRLTAVCAVRVVKVLYSLMSNFYRFVLVVLVGTSVLAAAMIPAVAQSSDPEQQKKEQEFISEVNRKIEREFQIREKILAEKEQKKREEQAKAEQAEAAKHQFSSLWGRSVPNYMFETYTLSEPPLRKR